MIKRYQSNYSNEVHQLIVSPSKHFYVTGSGELKYQKKPFELKLSNIAQEKKTHTIHYLLRDHFSRLFYWEICSSDTPLPIHDFLFRAWSKKTEHPLYGLPDYMTIPKNVQSYYTGLLDFVEAIGISYLKVTSGFQGGVRDIRTIEDELRMVDFYLGDMKYQNSNPQFEDVSKIAAEICSRFIDISYNKPTKKEIWISGIASDESMPVPKSYEAFKDAYLRTQQGKFSRSKKPRG